MCGRKEEARTLEGAKLFDSQLHVSAEATVSNRHELYNRKPFFLRSKFNFLMDGSLCTRRWKLAQGSWTEDPEDECWVDVIMLLGKKFTLQSPPVWTPQPLVFLVVAFCTGSSRSHMEVVESEQLASGLRCLWCVFPDSLHFTLLPRAPLTSKGPSCQAMKHIRASGLGSQPNLNEGAKCMTKKSPNTWHWAQQRPVVYK